MRKRRVGLWTMAAAGYAFLYIPLVIVVVYFLYKAHRRKAARAQERHAPAKDEDMVRCAQCGVHLPRSESLMSGELFYCTPEHRRSHESTDSRV